MKARVVWSLLSETFVEWYDDRAPRLGAALAYYTVFALAPGLILIIALAGLVLGKEAAQGQIISQVQDLAGEAGAQAVRAAIESGRSAGASLLATSLGVSTLLFGLWGVFGELQDALNTIWGVKSRPGRGIIGVIKQRFWSFTMVVGIGFLLLVSLAASAWLAAFGKVFSRLLPLPVAMMETTNALLSFVVITFMFAVIYKLLPDVNIAWRNVWTGAAVTAVLFTIGKTLIGLYLGRSTVASVYGAAGSLIVILLWVYYSAQVVFLGAEFTKVYSRRFYPVRRLAPVERRNGRRKGTMQVLLVVVAILSASCARVPSHFALPERAAAAQNRAFCAKELDVIVYSVAHPNGLIQDVTRACGGMLVDMSGPAIERMLSEYREYERAVIPSGTYAGNPADVQTFGVRAVVVASPRVSDATAYEITRAVFDNLDAFRRLHPAFETLSIANMVQAGGRAPVDAGATRYYLERRWLQ